MAKKVVIIDGRDYDAILDKLREAKHLVGSMRNSEKRNHILFMFDQIFERLAGPDDLERRVSCLESYDYYR